MLYFMKPVHFLLLRPLNLLPFLHSVAQFLAFTDLTRRLNCLTPVRTNGGLGLFILSKLKHKVKLTEKRKVGFVPPYKHAAAVAAERFFKSNICFLYWKYIRHNRKKERARQLKFGNNISNVPHFHSGSKYGKVLKERDSLMLGHKKE